jgi:hypothetical protein
MFYKDVLTVIRKEWLSFVRSDKGMIAMYAVLLVFWSWLLITTNDEAGNSKIIWLLTFAVVVGSNFFQSTYVIERVNGALEIILTSGLSRGAILLGKTLHVVLVTSAFGFACLGLSCLWGTFIPVSIARPEITYYDFAVFFGAAFYNAAAACWLSIVFPSPRLVPLMAVGLTMCMIAIYYAIPIMYPPAKPFVDWILLGGLIVVGALFQILARQAFNSEKVIQPISL